MYPTRDQVYRAQENGNVRAFLHIIRHGESSGFTLPHTESDYFIVNGRSKLTSLARHPYHDIPTTRGARASGAYQFLGTTWAEVSDKYSLPTFEPEWQDFAAVARIGYRGALDDLLAGRFDEAVERCRLEWTSLPGAAESSARWTMDKARALYQQFGGWVGQAPVATPAPIEEIEIKSVEHYQSPNPDQSGYSQPSQSIGNTGMDPITALSIFGPMIAQLIPQVGKLFADPEDKKEQRNLAAIQLVLDTFTKAGTKNPDANGTDVVQVAAAVEAVRRDAALKAEVTKAVLTEPTIMSMLEVGGGIRAARQHDLEVMQSDKPFWRTSAVFWISMLMLPMIYWYVGSSIVGGIVIPPEWPWYAQVPLKMFGLAWDAGAKVGLANLVVGLVLGGIVGVYYGVSVTQQKQQSPAASEAAKA